MICGRCASAEIEPSRVEPRRATARRGAPRRRPYGDLVVTQITTTTPTRVDSASSRPAAHDHEHAFVVGTLATAAESRASSIAFSIAFHGARRFVPPRHVQKVFAGMGATASAYIVGQRRVLAAQFLTGGRQAASDIALRTGFADLSYFYRSFRKRYGTSSKRYAGGGGHVAASRSATAVIAAPAVSSVVLQRGGISRGMPDR